MRNLASLRVALLAASTIGMSGMRVGGGSTADGVAAGATARCDQAMGSLERAWRGTGDWRALAPYPIPREASPTDSIGVWLERSRGADGAFVLRRVSVGETTVASVGGADCDIEITRHRRMYDSVAMASSFTDDRLRELLGQSTSGIIYAWSPRMPLSMRGIEEARAAAAALGVTFTAIAAEASSAELEATAIDTAFRHPLSSLELVYRNATIHYPTVLFYQSGVLLGSAIPGYKSRDTYQQLAREAMTGETTVASAAPTFWVDQKAQVTTSRTVQTVRPVGFFFKPVAGTDLVSYSSEGKSFLFDLGTRREQRVPGNVDPVPTPDGRFLTRPGLLFHPVSALWAGDTVPMFADRDLPDEYQTISILKQSKAAIRYRVVTGWRTGLRTRDYDVTLAPDGTPTRIQPLGQPSVPCPERSFSLPISSKGSREVGVFDRISKTNRIIEVTDDGRCVDILDLGFASGKLSFSYDGSAVAFATSRVNVDAEGTFLKPEENFYKDALVLYRKAGRVVSLSSNRALSGMTFPDFLPDGRSIILDQRSRFRPMEVIRVVEVK